MKLTQDNMELLETEVISTIVTVRYFNHPKGIIANIRHGSGINSYGYNEGLTLDELKTEVSKILNTNET